MRVRMVFDNETIKKHTNLNYMDLINLASSIEVIPDNSAPVYIKSKDNIVNGDISWLFGKGFER